MVLNRKGQIRALFSVGDASAARVVPVEHATETKLEDPEATRQRSTSGAVKAMGLSLGELSKELEKVRRLKESLDSAERVSKIDAALIDPSFVADRLDNGGKDREFEALVSSVRRFGQKVPVLLRPHPDKPSRYQTAYGHRRIRAARNLCLPVLAIVRPLSDIEMVLAQGKENSERRDLSFIERALFAHELIARGFERGVIQDALSLHKAEMTRLLQVAEIVPKYILRAIGSAPKVGRPRWVALVALLNGEGAMVEANDEVTRQSFREASSNERFDLLFTRLQRRKPPASSGSQEIVDEKGRVVAHLTVIKGKMRLDFVDRFAGGFDAFLCEALPKFLEKFTKDRGDAAGAS